MICISFPWHLNSCRKILIRMCESVVPQDSFHILPQYLGTLGMHICPGSLVSDGCLLTASQHPHFHVPRFQASHPLPLPGFNGQLYSPAAHYPAAAVTLDQDTKLLSLLATDVSMNVRHLWASQPFDEECPLPPLPGAASFSLLRRIVIVCRVPYPR